MTVDGVVDKVLANGKGALLAKLDLEDAFKHINVRPEDWELLGSTITEKAPDGSCHTKYYVDLGLPFGLSSAPKLFDDYAEVLEFTMFEHGASWVGHYLDDFVTVGPPNSPICNNNFGIMLAACDYLNFKISSSPGKWFPPPQNWKFWAL